ncbi:MFS transporter (plasmid) [Rhizobium sp. WYJ-E13]|nr:MFS transporter [Rhizobium sp. WYJ-E13]
MLMLAAVGGALEFYDFVIFIFLADAIGMIFFPPDLPEWLVTVETLGIFAAGYILRPLGGIVLAHFGDLFGRKQVFAFSILLMASSTLAIAFLPGYRSIGVAAPLLLLVLRIMQGIAIGGEVPGAWTFVSEHVAPNRVGFACGMICAGLTIGILVGSTITTAITALLPTDHFLRYGWRLPFLLGGIFGAIGVYLRRMLQETPVFVTMRTRKLLVPEMPLRVVVKDYRAGVVISVLCTWVLTASVVMLTLMLPTVLEQSHTISREESLIAASTSTISLTIGVVLAGVILDRIGPARVLVLGGLMFACGDAAFLELAKPGLEHLYLLSAVVGFSGAVASAVPVVMISCFPPPVRFSGVSFSYNLSYAVCGGLTLVGLAAFLQIDPLSHIYYLLFVSILETALGLYLWTVPSALRFQRRDPEGPVSKAAATG